MVQYKLVYFNARGRAELARFIFAVAGQEYEDIRFEREDWPKYKEKAPFGQSPYLEVHDDSNTFVLAQSITIARYLARKFNLSGKNELEEAQVDMYADQITDLVNELVKIKRETSVEKAQELSEKLYSEVLPNNMKLFEAKLTSNNTGYLVGDSLTWVDLYLYVVLEWLSEKRESILEHFPHSKALIEKISNHERIAEWIKKRPVTAL